MKKLIKEAIHILFKLMNYFMQKNSEERPIYEPTKDKLNLWLTNENTIIKDGRIKYWFNKRTPKYKIKWVLFKDWIKSLF